jgi:UDP-N-acetylglucosamine transferase subunit ALG13
VIFVVVGTHEQPFDRLIREIDRLGAAGTLPLPAFCQIGYGEYEPRSVPFARMLDFEDMKRRTSEASLIVTHGGPGCILPALGSSRPVVLVPRRHAFGEHVDDHQVAFCRRVGADYGHPVVEEIEDLGAGIQLALEHGAGIARHASGDEAGTYLAGRVERLLSLRRRAAG